ncbi:hypothetical protein D9758_012167 [Tetrapyrgos nigripes]|uniref:PX domain-containing protein n=1 Tax=Tetrapyrgos nigripes TaxID=182062 RepID=A0A8H5FLD9_9AGAR|nr:hypothetical protein D9758_012167 [Tetrapyrgos nigripes]
MITAQLVGLFSTTMKPLTPAIRIAQGSPGVAVLDGPIAHDNYKRAVYRAPPLRFIVTMLSPAKQGSGYAFGMRITPVGHDRSSRLSLSSNSSRGTGSSGGSSGRSNVEYDIWRKWEDCLWFQDTLELEYSRMARMKRQRLLHGKGVKKDGFYMQDKASSWESLPPGPDPNSVAQNLHDLVPKLTKKGTLFRASQATIEQRQKELTAFVAELFKDNVPALMEELRQDRIVTDFFGYWRRDYDLDMKNSPPNGRPDKPRSSISSSVFSSYFSSSNVNVDSDAKSTTSSTSPPASPKSPRVSVTTEAFRYARAHKQKQKAKESGSPTSLRHRVTSSMSTSSTSSGSSSSSRNSTSSMTSVSTSTSTIEETPTPSPRVVPATQRFLNSLAEAGTPSHSDSEGVVSNGLSKRPRKRSSKETLYRRSARIFTSPPSIYEDDALRTPTAAHHRAYRDSWQTTASTSTYLEGLNVTIPTSPAHIHHKSRLSIGSIATFMTDSSADAVIPRPDVRPVMPRHKLLSLGNRKSRPVSIYTVTDEGSWSDGDEDMLDAYLFDQFPMPAHLFPPREDDENEVSTIGGSDSKSVGSGTTESRPDTPLGRRTSVSSATTVSEEQEQVVERQGDPPAIPPMSPVSPLMPPSPTFSDASTAFSFAASEASSASSVVSSPSALSTNITIKAAHNKSIILLRVPRSTEFSVIRQKVQDKFITQEKIPLSESFTMAYVSTVPVPVLEDLPKDVGDDEGEQGQDNRGRSDSVSSMSGIQMSLVTRQEDWEVALASAAESRKITLRILDTIS